MKSAPAPAPATGRTPHPVHHLRRELAALRSRIHEVRNDSLFTPPTATRLGSVVLEQMRLRHLRAGLNVHLGQLDYFLAQEPRELAGDWLTLIDALDLQTVWLADRARSIWHISRSLADALDGLAVASGSLTGPIVAARLWLNDQQSSTPKVDAAAAVEPAGLSAA